MREKSQWIPRFFEGKHYYFFYQGIFQDDLIFGNLVKNCFNKILGVSSWKVAWYLLLYFTKAFFKMTTFLGIQ